MEFEYTYIKKRAEFGSPCLFAPDGVKLLCNILPDKTLAEKYTLKNPANKATQDRCIYSAHEVNTHRPDFVDRGMNHEQGGWPKDLNIFDEEAVLRYKKKLEREDNYVASMRVLTKILEHAILQNNAINIYENYYGDVIKDCNFNESRSQIRNEFKDIGSEKGRPVSHLSWSPIREAQFAASYCDIQFQSDFMDSTEAYIWNIEIPNAPVETFQSGMAIVNLEWNTIDYNLLAGGMITGDICVYDVRKSPNHVLITPDVLRHRDPVHSIIWLNSKSGCDFFSTSSDGIIKWWDCRNLKQTIDSLILDLGKTQKISEARSASCLEFDPSIPARFMVGTEDGCVIGGNRKGVNIAEKLPWIIRTHYGPVYSIQRNQAFSKTFLTVGDWRVRIWSEDCKESAIMWTKPYKVPLVAAEWSKTRYSAFIVARADGYVDLWDLLQDQTSPVVSMRVSENQLTSLRFEGEGRFVLVGDKRGRTKLVQFGGNLTESDKLDKANLGAIFERETRREKILESRIKEIRLAMKLKEEHMKEAEKKSSEFKIEEEQNEEVVKAEEDYWEAVIALKVAYLEAAKKKEGTVEEEEAEEMKELKSEEELLAEAKEDKKEVEEPPAQE